MLYAEQIAAALTANDHQQLIALAISFASKLEHLEAQLGGEQEVVSQRRAYRSAQRARQRATSGDNRRQTATSGDPPSSPLPSPSSPTTLLTTSFPPPPPEHSEHTSELGQEEQESPTEPTESPGMLDIADLADAETADTSVRLALSVALGEHIRDVAAFLRTRNSTTWAAWMRAMLKLIGPGSPFTAEDLAGACADCLALDQPISGPHALRAFVAKRQQERIAPHPPPLRLSRSGFGRGEAEDEAAGARRRKESHVSTRRANTLDGDVWWERMQRESNLTGHALWAYAYDRRDEPGAAQGPSAA